MTLFGYVILTGVDLYDLLLVFSVIFSFDHA